MEKKFKFSDRSAVSKIVYLTVIAILCVSAIVIGIVAANSRKKTDNAPPIGDGTNIGDNTDGNGTADEGTDGSQNTEKPNKPEIKISFVSPAVGTVIKSHSSTVPVFSETLEEWRIHTGLDISVADNSEIYASCGGEVTGVYKDPMLGTTVELTHSANHKSYYSNLDPDSIAVKVGDVVEQGDVIASVGDSAISEIADEPHVHFELKVNGSSVNPLDYITDDSKEAALGIVSGESAA
jgi:murein DD-endopeptidase MepM/ murein hydrolase activator NlpD